jgi:hypothetical protein
MYLFALVAGVMAVSLLIAGCQRPRVALFVAAVLWGLYAVYEHQVASGVLCEQPCNIRVDLVLFFPILGLVTFWAYRSYMSLPGGAKAIGITLGVIGLFVVALFAEQYVGSFALLGLVLVGALAIGVYVMRTRSVANRS